jgi:serine protease
MNTKIAAAALFLFSATSLFAADSTGRYLVATREPVDVSDAAPATRDGGRGRLGARFEAFRSVNGYAADLTAAEVAAVRASAGVKFVEPVRERHIMEVRNPNAQTTPYGVAMVNAPASWTVSQPGAVNVVVLDTGIDYTHPELAPQYAGGWNAITKTNDPMDNNGHGTHCAGTIGAADNGLGVIGVAPKVRLWAVKVLDAKGSGTSESVIKGIDWVLARKQELGGDWVMSLSLGSSESSDLEKQAFQRAEDAGVLTVAASGNDSVPDAPAPVGFPAAYPSVIAVGAIDSTKTIADFSNQGPELALVAPGVDVLSTMRLGTGSIAYVGTGSSTLAGAEISGSPKSSLSGRFVFCGLGKPAEFPSSVKGNIALIKRGELKFGEKVKNAKAAGATAVVIFNNDTSAMNWTLIGDDPADKTFGWPLSVGVSLADGTWLQQHPDESITVAFRADDYGMMSGTSMATPHVVGVAALAWSVAPSATAKQVRQALVATAHDLGTAGTDPVYGFGLADATDAAKMLAPGAFGSGGTPLPPPIVGGRRILKH